MKIKKAFKEGINKTIRLKSLPNKNTNTSYRQSSPDKLEKSSNNPMIIKIN